MQPYILRNTLEFTKHFYIYYAIGSSITWQVLTLGLYIRKMRGNEIICLKSELESKFSLMELTSNHRQ